MQIREKEGKANVKNVSTFLIKREAGEKEAKKKKLYRKAKKSCSRICKKKKTRWKKKEETGKARTENGVWEITGRERRGERKIEENKKRERVERILYGIVRRGGRKIMREGKRERGEEDRIKK